MNIKVAVLGAGRVGEFLAWQFPAGIERVIIDPNAKKAQALAEKFGGSHASGSEAASQADVVAAALPAADVPAAFEELAKIVKPGAIVLNMSTEAVIGEDFKKTNPNARFINAKIVGHARSMQLGMPGYLITDTDDAAILEKIAVALPGFAKVMPGDTSMVAVANKIGAGEGIAAAFAVRKKLRESGVPEQWTDVVISTVCAGTIRAYVEGDLGEFARKIAEKLERESTP